MKKIFIVIVLVLSINLVAEIRFVSKTGSNTYPYTSWETSGRTIQGVMDSSSFGDTIYVGAGKYEEKIVFKRGISLIGIDRDSCFIDGKKFYSLNGWALIIITDSCLIQGFTISNIYRTGHGIYSTYKSQYFQVINNKLDNCDTGISLTHTNADIENNLINYCNNGIEFHSDNSGKVNILNNTITKCSNGIYIAFGGEAFIRNNIILATDPYDECILNYNGKIQAYNNLTIGKNDGFNAFFVVNFEDAIINNNIILGTFSGLNDSNVGAVNLARGYFYNNILIGPRLGISKWRDDTIFVSYNSFWENAKFTNFVFDSTNILTNPMIALQRGDSLLTLEDTLSPLSYIPQLFSPLIDGGHPDILDKDGTRSDIGLFGGPYGEEVIYRDYAPSIPKNLKITKDTLGVFLSWNNSAEADLKNYLVYTDSVENFEITPFKLLTETKAYSIKVADSLTGSMFFKVVSIDSAGNMSFASEEVGIRKPVGLNNERFTIVDNNYLYQNYPNPFNPSTRIAYKISKDGYLRLRVYDIKGELVELIKEGTITKGYYEENYTPKGLASGMYILRIDLSDNNNIPVYSEQRKMLLVK